MPPEPISPELALVDPELGARARALLPDRMSAAPPPRHASVATTAPAPAAAPGETHHGRYPLWARLTATLWVLVLGILVGGTAIPHAQERPRVIPPAEDATICELPQEPDPLPTRPLGPIGTP
jgi:hypothetical protein